MFFFEPKVVQHWVQSPCSLTLVWSMKVGFVCLHSTVSEESSWDEIFIMKWITPCGMREPRPVTLPFKCVCMCSVITGFPLTDSHWPKSPFNLLKPCLGSERVLSIDEMRCATSSTGPSSQMETWASNRCHIYHFKGNFYKSPPAIWQGFWGLMSCDKP